ATLPCGIADLEPGLMRVAPLPDSFTLELWLLTHEDLRRTARIRAFLDFMAEALAKEVRCWRGGLQAVLGGPAGRMKLRQRHPPDNGQPCSRQRGALYCSATLTDQGANDARIC